MRPLVGWLLPMLIAGWVGMVQADPGAICRRIVRAAPAGGAQALLQAVARGDAAQAAAAIEVGANPNARYSNNGHTLLMEAVASPDNMAMLDLLWQAGASPFLTDQFGRTATSGADPGNAGWLASKIATLPIPTAADEQEWLVNVRARQRSALCDQYDRFRRAPAGANLLQNALEGRLPVDQAIVKLLAESGLALEPPTVYQARPLALAAALATPDALDNLLAAGADPNVIDPLGRSALTHAILNARQVNAAHLIDAHAVVNPPIGSTQPLPLAIEQEDADIVRLLFERGVSVEQRAADGAAPVAISVKAGNVAITTLLLQHMADPNGRDANRHPALVLAARAGSNKLASLLLASRADASLAGPDGRSALDILVSQRPETGPVPSQTQPVNNMPDDSPVALDVTVPPQPQGDRLHAEDLEGDSNGGYLMAVDAQITTLERAARQDIRRQVDTWFAPDTAARSLEAEIGALEQRIAADDASLRDQTSELARVQALRAAQVQEGIAQRAELAALARGRDARMEQVAAIVANLRRELEIQRQLRARLDAVTTDVARLAEDFTLGRTDSFSQRPVLMREQESVRAEQNAKLIALDEGMVRSSARAAREREEAARPVAQAQHELAALRQQRFAMVSEAKSALVAAQSQLAKHLKGCGAPSEDVAHSCHDPKTCMEMKERDARRLALTKAVDRSDVRDPDIAELQAVLEREQSWTRNKLREMELRHGQEADAARAHRAEVVRTKAVDLLERELRIKNLELSYTDQRNLLLLDASNIMAALESRYGPKHQQLYEAAAQVKTSLTRTGPDDANQGLLGWAKIASLRGEYGEGEDTSQPPGLRRMAELVGALNMNWGPFRVGLDGEALLARKISLADAQRQASAQRIATLSKSLQSIAAQRQDKQRDLEELLQRRRDGSGAGTERGRLEQAMEELVGLYVQLLREAFRPEAMQTLDGAELMARETALRQDISTVTGKAFINPLVTAIDALPEVPAAAVVQFNDVPDIPPLRFVDLDAGQSGLLAAYWFGRIDFGSAHWLRVTEELSARRRMGKVFQQAVTSHAKFDRADFAPVPLPSQSAYRFIVRDNSYWIRADGSLRSYLDRDQNAMFSYQFSTPEDSGDGKTLRDAYRTYAAHVAAAYPTMSDARRDVVRAVEGAFRALDRDDRSHKLAELSWKLVSAADLALSASEPLGAYYALYKVLCKLSAWDDDKGVLDAEEIIADIVFLFPAGNFFPKPTRATVGDFSLSIRKTLITDLTTSVLFHYDDLLARARQAGQVVGLGTQSPVFDEIMQLRGALADSRWVSEGSAVAGPTEASAWSKKVKPARIEGGGLTLTRVTDKPAIYVNGPLSLAVKTKLRRCLGLPLLAQPLREKRSGALLFGVARNSQNATSCIVFIDE
jgi:ankyrin repeat protein